MALSSRGRVSFPRVYSAESINDDDNPKFSVTLVFDTDTMAPDQLALYKQMESDANKLAVKEFGCKLGGIAKEGGVVRSPFRKTDEKPKFFDPGKTFVRFSSKYRPNVVDRDRTPIPEDSGDFYAGCWAHVSYEMSTYDYMGNKGISMNLVNVQKTGDDEPFGGTRSAVEDDFAVLPETEEIPF